MFVFWNGQQCSSLYIESIAARSIKNTVPLTITWLEMDREEVERPTVGGLAERIHPASEVGHTVNGRYDDPHFGLAIVLADPAR